jgi:GT2 family glycosyltransferase
MSLSLADARFHLERALGLIRRGIISLHRRGWISTWELALSRLRNGPRARDRSLYLATDESASLVPATTDRPRASIVIPVFNHVAHTLRCLRALAQHPPSTAHEIIVVDDGSTDATSAMLGDLPGLRYHRRPENGGFIAACNDGARVARGEFLVFLNNDTVPQPGWLEALLGTFATQPDTGLAGAQLLYPDGRLQEAGGVVFNDGSGWNYGRFESPDDPRFAYLRDADYVSGAAIAIPRALFQALGGFDARYAPAYYEDTDLAFAVRAAGRRVVYQPAARVVHEEGTTSGTDTATGAKAFQPRNRSRFAERHRAALATHPDRGVVPSPHTLHRGQRQVLVIDAMTPAADQDSGSVRLINLMRLLREEGAHVVFLPANRAHAGAYTEALQQLGVEAWYAPYAARPPAWLREHGHRFDTVMVSRHYVAREFLPLLRRHAPRARIVFDTVDLHYLREQRGAELHSDAALGRAALRTRALELDVIGRSDVTLVVSETERALLARDAPGAAVEVLSNLHRLADSGKPYAQRHDLVFVGGFRHPPNVDAVRWFVDAILPLVREGLPEVFLHCIGSNVPPEIDALSTREGVRIHGHVRDIGPFMDGCRVSVAPLRYGAGVKGKINLAMAHGQPVVATPLAVEGMHLRDGHDVLVAEDPRAFADAVVRLYRDEVLWRQLSANGRDNVLRHFSPDAARDTVRRVFFRG